ncbi:MAG: glycosyltransferase family 4 protein [Candidatus Bipolaricaulaceae bacterium]
MRYLIFTLHYIAQIIKPFIRLLPYPLQTLVRNIYHKLVQVSRVSTSTTFDIEVQNKRYAKQSDILSFPKKPKGSVAYATNRLINAQKNELFIGGGERYCLALSNLLLQLGFKVTVFQMSSKEFEINYNGLPIVGLRYGKNFAEFHYEFSNNFYHESLRYDHVIYNLPEIASGKVRPDALLICHGIWFDHDLHGPIVRTKLWFEHLYNALSQPQKIVSVDMNSINVVRALWPKLAEKMIFLPNFVDTDQFSPPKVRENKTPIVIIPRRAAILRGSRIMEEILSHLTEDCHIYWIGKGDYSENVVLEKLEQNDARFKFFHADFEEIAHFYRLADIVVIPSIAAEGTSLSALEAMASGCAVVATHVGGLTNLIIHGFNGLLVEPSGEKIAKAISYLITNPQKRAEMQRHARMIAEFFSKQIWEDRWKHVLKELRWL